MHIHVHLNVEGLFIWGARMWREHSHVGGAHDGVDIHSAYMWGGGHSRVERTSHQSKIFLLLDIFLN